MRSAPIQVAWKFRDSLIQIEDTVLRTEDSPRNFFSDTRRILHLRRIAADKAVTESFPLVFGIPLAGSVTDCLERNVKYPDQLNFEEDEEKASLGGFATISGYDEEQIRYGF
jgi:hypothetical protein